MGLKGTPRLAGLALLLASTACSPMAVPSTAGAPISVVHATSAAPPKPTVTEILPSPTPEPPLAALVNGEPIYLADYEHRLDRYEASLVARGMDPSSPEGQQSRAQARERMLKVMIEQVLTEQAAVEADVVVSDAEVDGYMQGIIAENGGGEAFRAKLAAWGETPEEGWQEVRAQLIGMAMMERVLEVVPTTAEQVHARHILVDTPEEAQSMLAQLEAGADFAGLARSYSQDVSTRERGGDLGFFPRGILVAPEVEEAAFALRAGLFSDVVTSSLGYHIVQVVERDPARPISAENLHLLHDRAVQEWIEGLWDQAEVRRFVQTRP